MNHTELIHKFYTSFTEGNAQGMTSCYHENVTFEDPVFGKLKADRAVKMWEMLMSQKSAETKISYDNIEVNADNGSAQWVAKYSYGDNQRKVINNVQAKFKFKEGKIIQHTDTFDLWKWTRQALGVSGYILGWTPFMKTKIQATTNNKLNEYITKTK